jgi:hypothetical protein
VAEVAVKLPPVPPKLEASLPRPKPASRSRRRRPPSPARRHQDSTNAVAVGQSLAAHHRSRWPHSSRSPPGRWPRDPSSPVQTVPLRRASSPSRPRQIPPFRSVDVARDPRAENRPPWYCRVFPFPPDGPADYDQGSYARTRTPAADCPRPCPIDSRGTCDSRAPSSPELVLLCPESFVSGVSPTES